MTVVTESRLPGIASLQAGLAGTAALRRVESKLVEVAT